MWVIAALPRQSQKVHPKYDLRHFQSSDVDGWIDKTDVTIDDKEQVFILLLMH